MSPDIADPLSRLRRADPARDLPPAPPAEIDAALAALHHEAAAGDRPHRRVRPIAVALAAAAVVAVAVVSAVLVRSHRDNVAAPSPSPTATHDRAQSNLDVTRAVVEGLLREATVLPGSTRIDKPVAGMPAAPFELPGTSNLVTDAAFYTAPGTVTAAIAYVKAHPPSGMSLGVISTAGTGLQQGVSFDGGEGFGDRTRLPEVVYTIAPLATGVGIRVDARAIWVPERPAAARIDHVRSVDIVIDRPGSLPTVRRTLTGGPAQRIADAVNALRPQIPATRYCPMDRGFTDDLVFHTSTRTVHVVDHIGGCRSVTVEIQPPVVLDGSVDAVTMQQLGLPPTYGR